MPEKLTIDQVLVAALKADPHNARTHTKQPIYEHEMDRALDAVDRQVREGPLEEVRELGQFHLDRL